MMKKVKDKCIDLSIKYNNIALYKIIFIKSSSIKEKIFCLLMCLISFPIILLIYLLFLLSYPFYKLNKWCGRELDIYD